MTYLILLASAPVFIIAFYVYLRDRYEKEPVGILLKTLIAGMVITIPIIFLERFLMLFSNALYGLSHAFYVAFIVAALSEELFKFLAVYLLIWKNKNFNEKFDGIVYAVFVSLGFALVENIMYVTGGGAFVGYSRAITAVPAHALFGVSMGFHFGIAKFYQNRRKIQLIYALLIPIILHGIYDFILFSQHSSYVFLFIGFLIFIWFFGIRRMNRLSKASIYFRSKQKNDQKIIKR